MTQENTVRIGWRDCVPIDAPVDPSRLLETKAFRKAMRHLGVERGGRYARKCGWQMVRQVRRIARVAAQDGCWIELHTTNQTTAPPPWDRYEGLGLELRAVNRERHRIVWDISLYTVSGQYLWQFTRDDVYRYCYRADTLVRSAKRITAARCAENEKRREAEGLEYTSTLTGGARQLQETARAGCLRVSADGKSVTEILHDCGGSMTFSPPDSLRGMQASHDKVYHLVVEK